MSLIPKFYLLPGDKSQVSIFTLQKIKSVSNTYLSSKLAYLTYMVKLIINKVFTVHPLCLLCLSGNREYPGSFQNKLVRPSFKSVPNYILFQAKLKG